MVNGPSGAPFPEPVNRSLRKRAGLDAQRRKLILRKMEFVGTAAFHTSWSYLSTLGTCNSLRAKVASCAAVTAYQCLISTAYLR